jgi:putative ABC transport system permease protein
MLKNYVLVALRQLWKNKFYSGLNVIGLVAGVACFLLIMLYIAHDLQFDQYHEKKNRIYRLGLGGIEEGHPRSAVSGGVMPHVLQQNYAGIEKVVRFRKLPSVVALGEKSAFEENFFFADSTVFDVFSFPLLEGDKHTALVEPYSVALTEEAAMRYFGRTERVTGQLLQIDESMTFKVTGVLKNIPDFSHFKFDFLASASTLPVHPQEPVRTYQLTGWYAHYFYNYILLDEEANAETVGKNIVDAHKYHSDPEQYKLYGTAMGLFLQPLTDIHLNPLYGEIEPQGDRTILYILAAVAGLILLLACINFANINTALSLGRRKEVGLRKTLGARKAQVFSQFMGESFLICLFTFLLGLGVIELLLPWFSAFTGKRIEWAYLLDLQTAAIFFGAIVTTALLGGLYPSFMAGRFSPAAILKGIAPGSRKFAFRKTVIVFQFVISMVLVAGALIISSQVKHMLNKDLGLSTEQVLVVPTHGDPQVLAKLPVFFERLKQVPAVASSSVCELIPGETVYGIIAKFEGQENLNFRTIGIGFDYLQTFKMELVAGRDFSRTQPMDTLVDRVIINERLAKYFDWTPEEAIGKTYDRGGDGERPGEVIGVLKDFNFTSVKNEIGPLVLAYSSNFFDKAVVRIDNTQDLQSSIDQIKKTWNSVYPSRPFDFRFADESVQQQYQAEKKFGNLFTYFSSLAILIGTLGLFGMVSLDLSLRTKEVGIRKVLGANIRNLVSLLSSDFLKLVFIAFFISIPLSFWLSHQWLSGFAYRLTSIELLIAIPPLGVLLLALVAVVLQTMKSALANPVDSLKNE